MKAFFIFSTVVLAFAAGASSAPKNQMLVSRDQNDQSTNTVNPSFAQPIQNVKLSGDDGNTSQDVENTEEENSLMDDSGDYTSLMEEARRIEKGLVHDQFHQKFDIEKYLRDAKRMNVLSRIFSELHPDDSDRLEFKKSYESFNLPLNYRSPQVVSQCKNQEIEACKVVEMKSFEERIPEIKRAFTRLKDDAENYEQGSSQDFSTRFRELNRELNELTALFEAKFENPPLYPNVFLDFRDAHQKRARAKEQILHQRALAGRC